MEMLCMVCKELFVPDHGAPQLVCPPCCEEQLPEYRQWQPLTSKQERRYMEIIVSFIQ